MPTITPDAVLAAVAEAFGVDVADLAGSSLRRTVVRARHAAAYVLRHRCRLSNAEIGDLLKRDTSTISSSVQAAQRLAAQDRAYGARLALLVAPPAPRRPAAPAGSPIDRWAARSLPRRRCALAA